MGSAPAQQDPDCDKLAAAQNVARDAASVEAVLQSTENELQHTRKDLEKSQEDARDLKKDAGQAVP